MAPYDLISPALYVALGGVATRLLGRRSKGRSDSTDLEPGEAALSAASLTEIYRLWALVQGARGDAENFPNSWFNVKVDLVNARRLQVSFHNISNDGMYNQVWTLGSDVSDYVQHGRADRCLAEEIRDAKRDVTWWLDTNSAAGQSRMADLMALGFIRITTVVPMYLPIAAAYHAPTLPSGVEMVLVKDAASLSVFCETYKQTWREMQMPESVDTDMDMLIQDADTLHRQPFRYVYAVLDGVPVGVGCISWDPGAPQVPGPRTCMVANLGVQLRARGRGVGSALTHECLAVAAACGFTRATLLASVMGEHLYRRVGFMDAGGRLACFYGSFSEREPSMGLLSSSLPAALSSSFIPPVVQESAHRDVPFTFQPNVAPSSQSSGSVKRLETVLEDERSPTDSLGPEPGELSPHRQAVQDHLQQQQQQQQQGRAASGEGDSILMTSAFDDEPDPTAFATADAPTTTWMAPRPMVAPSLQTGLPSGQLSVTFTIGMDIDAYAARSVESVMPLQPWERPVYDRGASTKAIILRSYRSLGFWSTKLKGVPAVTELPLAEPRQPPQPEVLRSQEYAMPQGAMEWVMATARSQGTKVSTVLLAILKVLIARHTGAEDLVVGVPWVMTKMQNPPVDMDLVNVLPVRTTLSLEDMTFRSVLYLEKEAMKRALDHSRMSLDTVLNTLTLPRDPSAHPVYQVMMVFNNEFYRNRGLEGEGVLKRAEDQLALRRSQMHLTVHLYHSKNQPLTFVLQYSNIRYNEHAVHLLATHLQTAVQELMAGKDLDVKISSLSLLPREERDVVLYDFNQTHNEEFLQQPYLPVKFQQEARRRPDAVAAVDSSRTLTLRELELQTNRLAHYLKALGVGPDVAVACLFIRSVSILESFLAVLKAGGAYAALDPSYPQERLLGMLEDSDARVLLTTSNLLHLLPDCSAQTVAMDDPDVVQALAAAPDRLQAGPYSPDQLAFLSFTSGSTGRPKAAQLSHFNLRNFAQSEKKTRRLTEDDVFLHMHAVCFDVSPELMTDALWNGGKLVLAKPGGELSIEYVRDLMDQEQVTNTTFIPSLTQAWLTNGGFRGQGQSLKACLLAGEKVPPELVHELEDEIPGCTWIAAYGPTENTVMTSAMDLPKRPSCCPLGRAMPNTRIYLVDAKLQPVAIGVPGELMVAGAHVGAGYRNRPDATAAKFLDNPFAERDGDLAALYRPAYRTGDLARWTPDGNLLFIGRVDHQVKVNGQRVELEEIEAVIKQAVPGVKQVVVLVQNAQDNQVLVAYVTPETVDGQKLQAVLRPKLPVYMVPSGTSKDKSALQQAIHAAPFNCPVVMPLKKMPIMPSGKVNRKMLPAVDLMEGTDTPGDITEVLQEEAAAAPKAEQGFGQAAQAADGTAVSGVGSLEQELMQLLVPALGRKINQIKGEETLMAQGLSSFKATKLAGTIAKTFPLGPSNKSILGEELLQITVNQLRCRLQELAKSPRGRSLLTQVTKRRVEKKKAVAQSPEYKLKGLVAHALGKPVSALQMESSLLDQGMNSLQSMKLAGNINKVFGVKMSSHELRPSMLLQDLLDNILATMQESSSQSVVNSGSGSGFLSTKSLVQAAPTRSGKADDAQSWENVLEQLQQEVKQEAGTKPCWASPQQAQMYMLGLTKGTAAYSCCSQIHFKGSVDKEVFEAALRFIALRHAGLRTSFVKGGTWGPPVPDTSAPTVFVQVMPMAAYELDLQVEDVAEADLEARVRQVTDMSIDLHSNLSHFWLFRILRRSTACNGAAAAVSNGNGSAPAGEAAPEEWLLVMNIFHAVMDGWSLGVLMAELSLVYNAFMARKWPVLEPIKLQYTDWATEQQKLSGSETMQMKLDFWKENLRSAPAVLDLPLDHPRSDETDLACGGLRIPVEQELMERMEALAADLTCTLFCLCLTLYTVLLQKHTNQVDLMVGTPYANRSDPDTHDTVGYFVNPVAIRMDISGNPSFSQMVERVREAMTSAISNGDVPLLSVLKHADVPLARGTTPLFQTMFWLLDDPMAPFCRFSGLEYQDSKVLLTSDSKFELQTLTARELQVGIERRTAAGGEVRFELVAEYAKSLLEEDTVRRMLEHYVALMHQVLDTPRMPIVQLSLMTPEQRCMVLQSFSGEEDPALIAGLQPFTQMFRDAATRWPDAECLVSEEARLTYREVEEKANQLAHYLRSLGCGRGETVGVLMPRSIEHVLAFVAILQSGAAYCALDPANPRERLAGMVKDAEIGLVLTRDAHAQKVADSGAQVVSMSYTNYKLAKQPLTPLEGPQPEMDEIALVTFTSGSTGRPKANMLRQSNWSHWLAWFQREYRLDHTDCGVHHAAVNFDGSLLMLSFLAYGAKLVVAKHQGELDIQYICKLAEQEKATGIFFVPTLLQVYLKSSTGLATCRDSMRWLWTGGEKVTTELVQSFQQQLPEADIVGVYGPTECTVAMAVLTFPRSYESPGRSLARIGRPMTNCKVYLLDDSQQPVPVGVPGELAISGIVVGAGYRNRPEMTTQKFVPNPFAGPDAPQHLKYMYLTGDIAMWGSEGELYFLGRADHQVKFQGQRIELGEIEHAAAMMDDVQHVVARVFTERTGVDALALYVEPDTVNLAMLHEHLQNQLSSVMVPKYIVPMEELPRMVVGKVDVKKLPPPDPARHLAAAPGRRGVAATARVPSGTGSAALAAGSGQGGMSLEEGGEESQPESWMQGQEVDGPTFDRTLQLVAELAGVAVSDINLHLSLTELGIRSLQVTEFNNRVRMLVPDAPIDLAQLTGRTAAASILLLVASAPSAMASDGAKRLVALGGAGGAAAAAAAGEGDTELAVMQEAAGLHPTVSPPPYMLRQRVPPLAQAGRILLTGSTGFLGAYLLHSLLQMTDAQVVCLVRVRAGQSARSRVLGNLRYYGLALTPAQAERVVPVVGTLGQERLGLEVSEFLELANSVDAVFHAGAAIHFFGVYEQLADTNIEGTRDIVQLACKHGVPLHYVSTESVLPTRPDLPLPYPEVQGGSLLRLLQQGDIPSGGYPRTKMVAECLVWTAAERGLPITVWRLGHMGLPRTAPPSAASPSTDQKDWKQGLLKACIKLRAFPDVDTMPRAGAEKLFEMSETDWVARAIVRVALLPRTVWRNRCIHAHNSQPPDPKLVFRRLKAVVPDLELLPLDRFTTLLNSASQEILARDKGQKDYPTDVVMSSICWPSADAANAQLQYIGGLYSGIQQEMLQELAQEHPVAECVLHSKMDADFIDKYLAILLQAVAEDVNSSMESVPSLYLP